MGILRKPVIGWRRYDVSIPGLLVSDSSVIMPCERAESWCRGGYDIENKKRLPRCTNGPKAECSCGFYAFKTEDQLFDSYYMSHGIVAEVWMWGTVHEFAKGWRAQYTYPKMLYAYGPLAESCSARIARDYQIPVKPFRLQWPERAMTMDEIRERRWNAQPDSKTEKELLIELSDGSKTALTVLKKRLSSAICTRKKSIIRQVKQLQDTKDSLKLKQKKLEELRKIKL